VFVSNFLAYRFCQELEQESRAIAGRTARCRCTFWTASCGFCATARLSCSRSDCTVHAVSNVKCQKHLQAAQ